MHFKQVDFIDLGIEIDKIVTTEQADKFSELIKKVPKDKRIALVMHKDPDPDALAVAWTVAFYAKQFGIDSNFFGTGHISHPMNKTMTNRLRIEIKDEEFYRKNEKHFDLVVFCDTRRNNASLDIAPNIIIDHHIETEIEDQCLVIFQNVGAASTLAYLLTKKLNMTISPELATALLIGINTDTKDLTKADETTTCDQAVHRELLSLCDYPLFAHISFRYEIPRQHLKSMGMVDDSCFDGYVAVASAGEISHGQKDVCAIMADMIFRIPEIRLAVVIAIEEGQYIRASVRTDMELIEINHFCKEIFEDGTITDTGQSSAGARYGSGGAKVPLSKREREIWEISDPEERETLFNVNLKRFKKRIKKYLF